MTHPLGLAPAPTPEVRVWGWGLRLGHWALAATVLACLALYQGGPWHEGLGYAALALASARIAWGFLPCRITGPHAAFAAFLRPPRATWAYARASLAGVEPRHIGHNPLGGWMIVALLACAVLAAGSGALYVTDRFWGVEWLYRMHQVSSWAFAALVPLHGGGVALTSWLQRENLLAAMLTGRKPGP